MKKILVTGGAGFIGTNFVRFLLKRYPEVEITNVDKLTYAGHPGNLSELKDDPRHRFVQADIADAEKMHELVGESDAVVNFAAETHVDRSIVDSTEFLRTNVLGTQVLLEAARQTKLGRFLHISTDEVYGSIPKPESATETSPLEPNSPYAASKAAADLLVRSYVVTYRVPASITRSSNNYGPYQYPEKFIPLSITKALSGEKIPLYGDGQQERDWIYVDDNCEAIDLVLRQGKVGEIYNIGAGEEVQNIMLLRQTLELLGKPTSLIEPVTDRPGHDRRYAMKVGKLESLGWKRRHNLEQGLQKTVQWYQNNPAWWKSLKTNAAPHWLAKERQA